jgi:hypothetical protein
MEAKDNYNRNFRNANNVNNFANENGNQDHNGNDNDGHGNDHRNTLKQMDAALTQVAEFEKQTNLLLVHNT